MAFVWKLHQWTMSVRLFLERKGFPPQDFFWGFIVFLTMKRKKRRSLRWKTSFWNVWLLDDFSIPDEWKHTFLKEKFPWSSVSRVLFNALTRKVTEPNDWSGPLGRQLSWNKYNLRQHQQQVECIMTWHNGRWSADADVIYLNLPGWSIGHLLYSYSILPAKLCALLRAAHC